MRLGIFTHVAHHEQDQFFSAYGPYVREMNLWIKNFEEIDIVAPRASGECITTELAYKHKDISLSKVAAVSFTSTISSFSSILKLPCIIWKIFSVMHHADHLHIRCPGNIGLLASLCQIFFPGKPKTAKYAGNWDPEAKQPWTYRLQKRILHNTFLTKNMQVLVYGQWPNQTKNVLPFFTASFSEREITEVREKGFKGAFTFLFVGNLVEGKQPLEAIRLVENINVVERRGTDREICANLEVYGDGPEREKLEFYFQKKQLKNLVEFKGNRSLEELKEAYQKAHFIILPSQSEGWPKAIAEGMFYGCIPIATPVSCVPWMLGYGERGVLLTGAEKREETKEQSQIGRVDGGQRAEGEKIELNVQKILELLRDSKEMTRKSNLAKEWSQQYTLERFEAAIKEVLQNSTKQESSSLGRCAQ